MEATSCAGAVMLVRRPDVTHMTMDGMLERLSETHF
jgi:hypothetical protein